MEISGSDRIRIGSNIRTGTSTVRGYATVVMQDRSTITRDQGMFCTVQGGTVLGNTVHGCEYSTDRTSTVISDSVRGQVRSTVLRTRLCTRVYNNCQKVYEEETVMGIRTRLVRK
jgi:hypothetical protein